ncbi:MAG: helix-turn-helix transcriptional regulator [Ruminococcaceae bacterium]|nr:helix-turn-helix transcriptional regulator [Oscillospiraceae bacterium]
MDKINLCEIGKRIQLRRKQKGLTQEQIAEAMNVSIQMVSNLERGNKAIRIDNLVSISKILDISTDYILTGKETLRDIDLLMSQISQLSDKDRGMVEVIVEYCLHNK